MTSSIFIIKGATQSGKTQYLMSQYRDTLKNAEPGSVLWLAPNWRSVSDVRGRILDEKLEACCSPDVFTFDRFAQAILESSPSPIRPLTRSMKRQVVRQLIDEQIALGRITYFSSISSTSGLVDLVCELISEFKRLEIWPEDFQVACHSRGFTAKDSELLDIYEAYQQTLRENLLYDAEGRFWSARDWLQKGQKRPFENLRLVIVDGFTDFTRTQHEILEQLASWVQEIYISLPLESEPCRSDLFSKPLKTLKELKRRHKDLAIKEMAKPEACTWPAMSHLEKNLFVNPRRVKAAATTDGIEIFAAAKTQGEIELIGAAIKYLLVEKSVKPSEIAVVFRSPQDSSSLTVDILSQLGIPVACETCQTLDRVPAIRALKNLLQLDLDDWPFRQLLAVIGSNYFQPDWPEWQSGKSQVLVEETIRNLQIPRGRKFLLEQLSKSNAEESVVFAVLNRLASAFDSLPANATLPQWGKAWERLFNDTGLLKANSSNNNQLSATNDDDTIAWNCLVSVLSSGDRLAHWLNRRPLEINRCQAYKALVDILQTERMPKTDDELGKVRILSAASVRTLQIPYLFLAGLSEKAFPMPDREDRLYSEAEYQQLIESGLPLIPRTERTREEMLLFYEAVTRATRRLYLSYPALDDAANPLSPSPYLHEVEQACGIGKIKRTEATDLRPIPAADEPLSFAQYRVKAMAEALSGDVRLLAGAMRESNEETNCRTSQNIRAGLNTIIFRQDREHFSPVEGILPGKAVHKHLSTEFASNRSFTASELEQYATCPYRFLVENILRLELLEDVTLQLDILQRGQVVHEALAAFHRLVNESLGHVGSPLELEPEQFDQLLQQAIDDSLPKSSFNPVQRALAEVNRRTIAQWLTGYREQCERYDKLWKSCESPLAPELFEISFGKSKHRQDSLSIDEPLVFDAETEAIHISGRIDRIDTGKVGNQTVFNILDYKTGAAAGKFSLDDIARGTCLQLPIYAIACAELILSECNAIPWQAGYWQIRNNGFKEKKSLVMYQLTDGKIEPAPEWEQIRANLGKTIAGLVNGIRRGNFPVFCSNRDCTKNCSLNTICRIRQVRSIDKTWQPTQ